MLPTTLSAAHHAERCPSGAHSLSLTLALVRSASASIAQPQPQSQPQPPSQVREEVPVPVEITREVVKEVQVTVERPGPVVQVERIKEVLKEVP
jgi:hypothetical protein